MVIDSQHIQIESYLWCLPEGGVFGGGHSKDGSLRGLVPDVLLCERDLKRILLVAFVFRRGVKVHDASTTASSSLLLASVLHVYHRFAFGGPLTERW